MRDDLAVTTLLALEEALFTARVEGMSWDALSDASGYSADWVKRKVYAWADEHGHTRPRDTRTAPPITHYFSAVIRHGEASGAMRRARQV